MNVAWVGSAVCGRGPPQSVPAEPMARSLRLSIDRLVAGRSGPPTGRELGAEIASSTERRLTHNRLASEVGPSCGTCWSCPRCESSGGRGWWKPWRRKLVWPTRWPCSWSARSSRCSSRPTAVDGAGRDGDRLADGYRSNDAERHAAAHRGPAETQPARQLAAHRHRPPAITGRVDQLP